jgi:putative transcriptional regulator
MEGIMNDKQDVSDELIASLEEAVMIVQKKIKPSRVHNIPAMGDIDVQGARLRLGMSQSVFASTFGVSPATLKKWEQKVRRPAGAAKVLLRVIEREPDAVRRALCQDAA